MSTVDTPQLKETSKSKTLDLENGSQSNQKKQRSTSRVIKEKQINYRIKQSEERIFIWSRVISLLSMICIVLTLFTLSFCSWFFINLKEYLSYSVEPLLNIFKYLKP